MFRAFVRPSMLVIGALFLCAFTNPAAQIEQEVLNPVVRVETESSFGSGTVIYSGDEGVFILTNDHVIANAKVVVAKFWNLDLAGAEESTGNIAVTVVAHSAKEDLAILKVVNADFRARAVANLARADEPLYLGEDVIVAGGPLGSRIMVSKGFLGMITGVVAGHAVYVTSVPLLPGNSGGALFHMSGGHYTMIGVPEAVPTRPLDGDRTGKLRQLIPNISYVIPMASVWKFLSTVAPFSGRP